MAYSTEDYVLAFTSRTLEELRAETLWFNLTSQTETERWVNGARTVRFNRPNWVFNSTPTPDEGVRAQARARGANWPTPNRGDQSVLDFTRSGGLATANEILWEDLLELPWPVAEETRRRQLYELSRQLDVFLHAAILAGIAASDTTRIGTKNKVYLSPVAPYEADGDVGQLVYNAVEDYALKCEMLNVNSNTSDSFGRKYMVMSPAVFRQLSRYMLARKYSWDVLTSEILRENRIMAERGYEGRLHGIDILKWSGRTPVAGDTEGTNDWDIICGVRAAWRANVRPSLTQILTPSTNQVSNAPAWLSRQVQDYGHVEVHGGLMHRYNLRTQ